MGASTRSGSRRSNTSAGKAASRRLRVGVGSTGLSKVYLVPRINIGQTAGLHKLVSTGFLRRIQRGSVRYHTYVCHGENMQPRIVSGTGIPLSICAATHRPRQCANEKTPTACKRTDPLGSRVQYGSLHLLIRLAGRGEGNGAHSVHRHREQEGPGGVA